MKQVYAPANPAEAHMLAHLLEQNGIQAHIHGEALQGGVGELPAAGLLQLLVADEEHDRARAIIMDWERRNVPAPSDASEQPRVAVWMVLLVFMFGVGGGWFLKTAAVNNAIPIDAVQVDVDANGDGRTDTTYFYRVGASYVYKVALDRNFDGEVDATYFYGGEGTPTRHEKDENFDSFVESRGIYQDGNLRLVNVDTNRNGVADTQFFYRHDVLMREEIQDNRTGRIARVNYYANQRLDRSESDLDGDGFLETARTYDALGEIVSTETRLPH